MLAYHNDKKTKAKYLARIRRHRRLDHLTQGVGWERNGKTRGCAVGCTLESYDHARYPIELGVPIELARLEDRIFERLPRKAAMAWPEAFLQAIPVGADLSMVWPRFALWLLSADDSPMFKSAQNERVKAAIDGVSALYREWIDSGKKPTVERWCAVRSAAYAAADAAADAAASAAAYAAASAAAYAADAAAAYAAASAAADARTKAWCAMRDKLLELLASAPFAASRASGEERAT